MFFQRLLRLAPLVVAGLLPWGLVTSVNAQAKINSIADERECGPLTSPDPQRLPPKDYRTDRSWLAMVEHAHFPPQVENLVKPMFLYFGSSIAYTLHGYPNHVRALATLERLTVREGTDQPRGTDYSLDCYYRRAIRFVPDDHVVRMMYSLYLERHARHEQAVTQANYVDETASDDPITRRNLGLVFLDLKMPERAAAQLVKGREVDSNMQELRRRLAATAYVVAQPASAAASSAMP
jgi:CheY-like chemotaxis protein